MSPGQEIHLQSDAPSSVESVDQIQELRFVVGPFSGTASMGRCAESRNHRG